MPAPSFPRYFLGINCGRPSLRGYQHLVFISDTRVQVHEVGEEEHEAEEEDLSYVLTREEEWLEVSREIFFAVLDPELWRYQNELVIEDLPFVRDYLREHPRPLPPVPKTNHRVGVPKGTLP